MSIPQSASGPIQSRDDLVRHLSKGCRPKAEWRIGTEHEKFVYDLKTHKPVAYDGKPGIRQLLEGMQRFGWQPVREGENIIGLTQNGASLSLEPGGQFELSGAPLKTIHETCAEVNTHLEQTREIAGEIGAGVLGFGFAPNWTLAETPMMPKGRYKIMRDYMPKVGGYGLDMMFRTCTVQVNLDFESEADMVKKFRVGLALQPITTALFANSPFREGGPAAFSPTARRSGPMSTMRAPACCPGCSRTACRSSAMSITRWMCRCISSIATANISTWRARASANSWPAKFPKWRI